MESSDEKQRERLSSIGISEALTVSILTGVAYCLCYVETFGEAAFYGVPREYVSIQPTSVVAMVILLLIVLGAPLAPLTRIQLPARLGVVSATVMAEAFAALSGGAALIICATVLRGGRLPTNWLYVVMAAVAFPLYGLARNWYLWRKKRELYWKQAARDDLATRRKLVFFYSVYGVLFLLAAAFWFGFSTQSLGEYHRVVVQGPFRNNVVVWTLSDDVNILSEYSAAGHRIGAKMAVSKVDKDQPLVWRFVKTGVLSVRYATERPY